MRTAIIDWEVYVREKDIPPIWCGTIEKEEEPCCLEQEFSFGGKAVWLDNCSPFCDPEDREIKEQFADIIDHLNDARDIVGRWEQGRLLSIAITEAQTACMWAIKALNYND